MTPEEKAKELIEKFMIFSKDEEIKNFGESSRIGHVVRLKNAKACALICVDEILRVNRDSWSRIPDIGELKDYIPYVYWQSVKNELLK